MTTMEEHVERINCTRQTIKMLSALRESPSITDGSQPERNVIDHEVNRLWKIVDSAVDDIKMAAIRSIWED